MNQFMCGFFKPWWRKVGIATLLLACVLAAGWVRSNLASDTIVFPALVHKAKSTVSVSFVTVTSADNMVAWERAHEESSEFNVDEEIDLGSRYPTWRSFSPSDNQDWKDPGLKWRWQIWGLGVAESPLTDGAWLSLVVVPYWIIVSPLIVISACLLFWKPGARAVITEASSNPAQGSR